MLRLIGILLYLLLLSAGLGLPAWVIWQRDPLQNLDLVVYGFAVALVLAANFLLSALIGGALFPRYWWIGQMQGKDVFQMDGVYFLGLRLQRVPTRLQRLLFGVDEDIRRWNLVFGVLFLVLLVPHALGFLTAHRELDAWLPQRVRFPETLHQVTLSSLPVMKELGAPWRPDGVLADRVEREISKVQDQGAVNTVRRYRLAQLQLLSAFVPRERTSDPYFSSPGERLYFDRGQGARAVEQLQNLLSLPDLQRVDWSGGALTLIGFFHLSDRNYARAQKVLGQALAELGEGDETGISRYQVLLLAAQSALMNGDEDQAIEYLQVILTDERLPNEAYAFAMEHYAEALRLMGDYSRVPELLGKALELYKLGDDRGGIARVHLHLAALALDEGRRVEASEELSLAASLAEGLNDRFTLNMIARLSLAFAG